MGLSGQGYSVKDFLANGDGQVSLLMQGGTLNRELVTGLGFDFLQLFATFLTPAEYADGNPDKRWDAARNAAL